MNLVLEFLKVLSQFRRAELTINIYIMIWRRNGCSLLQMIDGNYSKICYSIGEPFILYLSVCQGETQNLTTSDPDSLDGPTIVWVNLFVRSFEKIDDVRMQFSVQITFRQQWNDNR